MFDIFVASQVFNPHTMAKKGSSCMHDTRKIIHLVATVACVSMFVALARGEGRGPDDTPKSHAKPVQTDFVISAWGGYVPELAQSMADCHFTVGGLKMPADPEVIAQCKRLGMKAMVHCGFPHDTLTEMSEEQIHRTVKNAVEKCGNSDTVIGYFIIDEPGPKEFPALAAAVRAIEKYAPGKIAFINLFPDFIFTPEYVEKKKAIGQPWSASVLFHADAPLSVSHARPTLARMSSALAVQVNDFGSSLCVSI